MVTLAVTQHKQESFHDRQKPSNETCLLHYEEDYSGRKTRHRGSLTYSGCFVSDFLPSSPALSSLMQHLHKADLVKFKACYHSWNAPTVYLTDVVSQGALLTERPDEQCWRLTGAGEQQWTEIRDLWRKRNVITRRRNWKHVQVWSGVCLGPFAASHSCVTLVSFSWIFIWWFIKMNSF